MHYNALYNHCLYQIKLFEDGEGSMLGRALPLAGLPWPENALLALDHEATVLWSATLTSDYFVLGHRSL